LTGRPSRETSPARPERWYFRRHFRTTSIEGYHRQLRKVTKTKAAFPTDQAVRKLRHLATERITQKWTVPVPNWALIRNQLAIRFEARMSSCFQIWFRFEAQRLHTFLECDSFARNRQPAGG
jgi:hypothetical protein